MPDQGAHEKPLLAQVDERYRDAYNVAAITVAAGDFIKMAAVAIGFLLMVGVIGSGYPKLVLVGLLFAGSVGLFFFGIGLLVAAQGQTLRASLASAVNSFPALTEAEKTQVMKL